MPNAVYDVLVTFLRLGCTAFGGPLAHVVLFRQVLCQQRRWVDENTYAELLAYCQLLPGPTSSQLGFLLGWQRAGWWGAWAAWLGFTMPAAVLLTCAAAWCATFTPSATWLVGLHVAVLAIIGHAVISMGRVWCPDVPRVLLAGGVMAAVVGWTSRWTPLCSLLIAAVIAVLLARYAARWWPTTSSPTVSAAVRLPTRAVGWACVAGGGLLFAGVLVWWWYHPSPTAWLTLTCMQAGVLVFGGGHVVVPWLHEPLVSHGIIDAATFWAAYGAAQLTPGPLFTVVAWCGYASGGLSHVGLALGAIFFPGLLLALGALRSYRRWAGSAWARPALLGLHAGVVGLLAAYVVSNAGHVISDLRTAVWVVVAWGLLTTGRVPAWMVVIGCLVMSGWMVTP